MRTRFVILGTNHPLQFGATSSSSEHVEAFRVYLRSLCRSEHIKLIAEEATIEALQKYFVSETIGAELARVEGLNHKMVDLTTDERVLLGVADCQLSTATTKLGSQFNLGPLRGRVNKISDQVREGTWVARTLLADTWPALMIVGANHVKGVERLIRSLRQKVVVADADYSP